VITGRFKGIALVLAASSLWGASGPLTKILRMYGFDITDVLSWRYLIGLLSPMAFSATLFKPINFRIDRARLCIGLLTPPAGSCIFIGSSLAEISIEELLKPLWPFLIAEIVILFLITYVTPLVMWLPRTLGY